METPSALRTLPDGVELVTEDVSVADWVDERLLPFRAPDEGVLVGEIVPTGFEAYARVFHPAYRLVGSRVEPVRWAQLAAARGAVAHPEMQLEGLVGSLDLGDPPSPGSLPEDECRALARALAPFTGTRDRGWFCLWEGFGFLSGSAGNLLTAPEGSRRAIRRPTRREALRRAEAGGRALARLPKVRIHPDPEGRGALRSDLLFRGPVEAASRFTFDGVYQSPNLWWPDDRAWCVATEIDVACTYVGGSAACIDAVLACSDLEALPSAEAHRFDGRGDSANAVPPTPA